MRYLEKVARDVSQGKAHFTEHELLEVDEQCDYFGKIEWI